MAETSEAPLKAGDGVQDFVLEALNGGTYSTLQARKAGLLLVLIFRSGCDTCQCSAPYFQRFQELYASKSDGNFQILGVSQDNAKKSEDFAQQHRLTFPILLDSMLEVAERYAITNVPNLYLLDGRDTIVEAITGHFSIKRFNDLARQIAQFLEVAYVPVVSETDRVPDMKPG